MPCLEWNGARIKLALVVDDQLLTGLSKYNSSVSPTKIVHLPERIERDEAREDWDGHQVDNHPANVLKFAMKDEDQGLQSIYGYNHDN